MISSTKNSTCIDTSSVWIDTYWDYVKIPELSTTHASTQGSYVSSQNRLPKAQNIPTCIDTYSYVSTHSGFSRHKIPLYASTHCSHVSTHSSQISLFHLFSSIYHTNHHKNSSPPDSWLDFFQISSLVIFETTWNLLHQLISWKLFISWISSWIGQFTP